MSIIGLGGVSSKRYYVEQFGYYYSFSKNDFIKLLKTGTKYGFVNLKNVDKVIKNKPNSYNIFKIVNWNTEDYKNALKYIK